jgi:DNA replication licensing factor MCM4
MPGTPAGRGRSAVPETPRERRQEDSPRQPATPSTPLTPIAAAAAEDDDDNNSQGEEEENGGGGNDDEDIDEEDSNQGQSTAQDQANGAGGLNGISAETHILGTNVNVPAAAATFTEFLRNFISIAASRKVQHAHDSQAEDDYSIMSTDSEAEPLYASNLRAFLDNPEESSSSFEIDTMHLYYHSEDCQKLYINLVNYPMEIVSLMDLVVKRELERMAAGSTDDIDIPAVQVRPFNLRNTNNLRELDPAAMDTLVSCRGMIVRSSPLIPDLKVAHFQCSVCGNTETNAIERGKVTEPSGKCGNCGTSSSYYIIHNRCVFGNKQMVRLQETPDEVPAGQTPASVLSFCYDDLVDSVQPGDKVEVTGVLRAQPVRVHHRMRKIKSVYRTYLDVIHFRPITGMENKKEDIQQWTAQRVQQLMDLSQDPEIYQKLTNSVAPSIWELEDCKKGILCMLFGGNHVRVKSGSGGGNNSDGTNDGGSTTNKLNKRGDINILLCGDPGTSKSQLLSYVNKLSTRYDGSYGALAAEQSDSHCIALLHQGDLHIWKREFRRRADSVSGTRSRNKRLGTGKRSVGLV